MKTTPRERTDFTRHMILPSTIEQFFFGHPILPKSIQNILLSDQNSDQRNVVYQGCC